MSLITSLTRMWLTRTIRPFTFKNEYDEVLPLDECEKPGLYVHIPFCKSICNFCPYCKEYYSKEKCDRYINYLIKEISKLGLKIFVAADLHQMFFGLPSSLPLWKSSLTEACGG